MGFRQITSNKPIESPKDLKGLKIRTPEFPISVSTFSALGANPTPMAFGELYMGLQQGAVDAQENPVANSYASKFNEIQDYLIMSNHQYMPLPVAISEYFWQTLTSEEKAVIEESSLIAAQFHRDLLREREEEIIQELQDSGMEVIYPDTALFQDKVDVVHAKFKALFQDEAINRLLELNE